MPNERDRAGARSYRLRSRYVRLYGTQRATSYGYSLWEFQVFGS